MDRIYSSNAHHLTCWGLQQQCTPSNLLGIAMRSVIVQRKMTKKQIALCTANTSVLRQVESILDITQNHGVIPYHIANINPPYQPLPPGLCRSTE